MAAADVRSTCFRAGLDRRRCPAARAPDRRRRSRDRLAWLRARAARWPVGWRRFAIDVVPLEDASRADDRDGGRRLSRACVFDHRLGDPGAADSASATTLRFFRPSPRPVRAASGPRGAAAGGGAAPGVPRGLRVLPAGRVARAAMGRRRLLPPASLSGVPARDHAHPRSAEPYVLLHPSVGDRPGPAPAARLSRGPPLFRHYAGLGACERRFERLLRDFSWASIRDLLRDSGPARRDRVRPVATASRSR